MPVKEEFESGLAESYAALHADMRQMKADLIRWMFIFWITQVIIEAFIFWVFFGN
ncbi:MAG: hypothetical protein HY327_04685 [Chloroflexi bacterium]|nr:hypothetical protein [Chloroflexota bacterium]